MTALFAQERLEGQRPFEELCKSLERKDPYGAALIAAFNKLSASLEDVTNKSNWEPTVQDAPIRNYLEIKMTKLPDDGNKFNQAEIVNKFLATTEWFECYEKHSRTEGTSARLSAVTTDALAKENCNHAIVIDTLLHLPSNFRPDFPYQTQMETTYNPSLAASPEAPTIRIRRSVQHTKHDGLILHQTKTLGPTSKTDVDFAEQLPLLTVRLIRIRSL